MCYYTRNDQALFSIRITEVFIISILLTGLSLLVYSGCVLLNPELRKEFVLYIVFAFMIVASGLKMDWLYISLEHFNLTSFRNIISKIIYIVACFFLIRNSGDYVKYTIILVVTTSVIPMFLNYLGIFSGKISIKRAYKRDIAPLKCIKPIIYLGLLTIGSKLFSNADVLLIKILMKEDSNTALGIYNASVLLPHALEGILMAVSAVVTPRLFIAVRNRNETETNIIMGRTSNALFFIVVPAVLSCLFFSRELMIFFAGDEYVTGAPCLQIYSMVLFTSSVITMAGTRLYTARQKEKELFYILIVAAAINAVLAYIFILKWGIIGATFTTLISNILLMIAELSIEQTWKYVFTFDKIKYVAGAIVVTGVFSVLKWCTQLSGLLLLIFSLFVAGVVYVALMLVIKESTTQIVIKKMRKLFSCIIVI